MSEELKEMSLKKLREVAVKLGIPESDAKLFTVKAPLIATINTLRAQEKVTTLNPAVDPKEAKIDEKRWRTKAQKMRAKLEAQPKVRFLIPLDPNEKVGVVREIEIKGRKEYVHISGAIETVQLNGYKTIIPKGKFVEIPQQVADVLSESYRLTQEAGKEYLVDRDKDVSSVLT